MRTVQLITTFLVLALSLFNFGRGIISGNGIAIGGFFFLSLLSLPAIALAWQEFRDGRKEADND